MAAFDKEFFNIGYLDTLAYKNTFVHRLNPATKLFITLVFIISVVSFGKYDVQRLIPFFLFPVFIIAAGDIPPGVIVKKLLVISPFILFVGIFNPLFDTEIKQNIFDTGISGGWISFTSIIIKFILTVGAALLLIATTSFPGICLALEKLLVPKIFVVQLLFLYRYIFVLAEEAMRIVRARNMRSFGKQGRGVKIFINLAGVLLIRSVERSERIYQAICSRGFNGRIRLAKDFRFGVEDIVFGFVAFSLIILLRRYDVVEMLGELFIN